MSETPFIVEATFHVRYAETDAQGIVHHASYIIYFEEGRSEYIRKRGSSYADFERGGHFLAVTEINARYLKSARYDDLITVRCWVAESRSRSLTFEYEIIHAETQERLLTGSSKHICLNREGQISRIPDLWQQWVSS
jgi:acyl-CoA thioester hydrolase